MTATEIEIRNIIKKFVGSDNFNENTRLYHDLHISGDDALEMIEEIAQKFSLCFEQFNFEDFFPGETEAMFAHLLKMVGIGPKYRALTVGNLISSALEGHWVNADSAT